MNKETRKKYNAYAKRVAELNGVDDASTLFTVEPTISQKLEDKQQQDNGFLSLINIRTVTDQSGAKVGLGVSGPIAGRTKTVPGVTPRRPRNVVAMDQKGYSCIQTNFDTAISYKQLDAWAKFDDFQPRVANQINHRQGLDRIMIGFNGTSRAETTDLDENPLLQDVNKGWLQNLREQSPKSAMKEGVEGSGKIKVGPGGDYENLDALVVDLGKLLTDWYARDGRLRVIVGRSLMDEKYWPMINSKKSATDELAAQVLVSQRTIGGHPGVAVPFVPDNTLLLTAPENLSIYVQEGGRRRYLKDEPEFDQIANYESSNEDYVIEDLDFAAMAENIEFGDWSAAAP